MTSRRKIYIALPDRLPAVIERERAAVEQHDGTPVTRDDVVEALLTIAIEFAGDGE